MAISGSSQFENECKKLRDIIELHKTKLEA
jgi:hypothetical protein